MRTSAVNPKRGEIWRVDLEPTRGKETQSRKRSDSDTRAVLVLVRAGVGESGVRLCAPILNYQPQRDELSFWRVELGDGDESGLSKLSCADVSRRGRWIYRVSCAKMASHIRPKRVLARKCWPRWSARSKQSRNRRCKVEHGWPMAAQLC